LDFLIFFKIQIKAQSAENKIAFSKFLEEVDAGRVIKLKFKVII
jgi:hypothetical protein